MSTQAQQPPADDNDVFDMERLPRHGPENEPAPLAEPPKAVERLRPMHFALASAAGAILWIMWPASAPPLTQAQLSTRLLDASAAPASHAGPPAAPIPAPAAIRATPPATGVDGDAQAKILDQQAQQAVAIIHAVDSLNARTSALEARLATLTPKPGASAARQTATGGRTGPARGKPAVPILPEYALNTIFDGQAWISHDDKVFIVREGDQIDDLKIMRISAKEHRVVTSRGIIH